LGVLPTISMYNEFFMHFLYLTFFFFFLCGGGGGGGRTGDMV
jgi:hypothetical protein